MAYLGTIVRHLEDTFHVKVHGQFHTPVSYTHLDVYKRQDLDTSPAEAAPGFL